VNNEDADADADSILLIRKKYYKYGKVIPKYDCSL
jgi:hypothetical protein